MLATWTRSAGRELDCPKALSARVVFWRQVNMGHRGAQMISLLFFEKEDAMPVIVKARSRRDDAKISPR